MSKRPPKLYGAERPTLSSQSSKASKRKSGLILAQVGAALINMFSRPQKSVKRPKKKKPSSGKTSIKWMIAKVFIVLGIWGGCACGLAVLWFSYDLPDVSRLQASSRKVSVTVQAQDGTIINTYGDLYEDMVKVNELPPYVAQALMAIEDHRFYKHFGIDIIGLARAFYANYRAKRTVQGGSTLTQQLAKNFLFTQGMYDVNDRTLRRKIQEAIMALWLEWKFTKDQILTMYLNRVYFGSGTYGIEAAARKYFNKPARQLTVYESAVIAGLLKAPSRYSPANNPQKARERATVVLNQMVEVGYIRSAEEYLKQQEQSTEEGIDLQGARFFADWVYESIPSLIGAYDEDLVVITTFDPQIQKHADAATKKTMEEFSKQLKTTEIALVAMTPTGAVKAMIGGMNYNKSQYNRATQALRQPGSTFKPFVYLAALESGMSPYTMISDGPVSFGKWTPKNFRLYRPQGEITLMEALTKSVNTVTARIAMEVGPRRIADVARRLGITSDLIDDLSICLGTTEVTLVELVAAFASFANQGRSVWPYGIVEIRNKKGDILYQRQETVESQVIEPRYVSEMNKMLQNVIANGSGKAAKIDCPVAGKTGSNADKDAWFVGYTSDLVTGVWTGNDNNAPMHKNSLGGRLPARTFAAFMKPVIQENPPSGTLLTGSNEIEEDPVAEEAVVYSTSKDVETGISVDTQDFEALIEQTANE